MVSTAMAGSGQGQGAPGSLDRFSEALQAGVMGPRLAAVTGAPISACHVLDGKFEPGVRAILLYELGGRLLRGDLLARPAQTAPEGNIGVVPPGVRLHLFPADPELPALPGVVDPARLGPAVSRALHRPGVTRGRVRAPRCRITVLRYRPGKRATVLVEFAEGGRYVAKAYHDPAKAAVVAQDSVALTLACTSAPQVRVAPTLAHVPDLAVVVQARVTGVPLQVLLDGPRGPVRAARAAVRRTGRALAEFHAPSVALSRQRPTDRELRRFGERAGRIRSVAPRMGASLAELADRLVDTQGRLPDVRLGHVHGDCKPSQFMLSGPHVHLLDLDHVGVADQAGDVGSFLASLRQLAVRHRLAASRRDCSEELAELRRLFLEAYQEVLGSGAEPRARWQEAVALERKALRAFARAPGSPLAGALTLEAHRCLDELEEET